MNNRDKFRITTDLIIKYDWLADKEEEIQSLLFSECSDSHSRDLVIHLLDKLIFIKIGEYGKLIDCLANSIMTNPEIKDEQLLLVSLAADHTPDSSQSVLYDLKLPFEKSKWRKHRKVNRYDHINRELKRNPNHTTFVLVDEFVGSGQTVLQRVETIRKQHADKKISLYVKCLISTKEGKKRIIDSGINFECFIELDKGISDFFIGSDLIEKLNVMTSLENKLSDSFGDVPLPHLGYGETEALYSRERGNTPNNVFPIFWWPQLKNKDDRNPLFYREMLL